MEFTGERVVPGKTPSDIYKEHIDRYIFASKLIKSKDILDVACGTGYGIEYMMGEGAKCAIGADISMESVKYAQCKFGRDEAISFVRANGIRLPFAEDSFDVVVSFETIEHVRQYRKFLIECRSVLKDNGLFICSTPNRRIFSPNCTKPPNPFHVKEFWPEEFYSLLNRYFVDITLYGQCDVNLKDKSVERNCGVHKFKDSEHISSAYIIAVAKKETKSNTLCQYPKSQ